MKDLQEESQIGLEISLDSEEVIEKHFMISKELLGTKTCPTCKVLCELSCKYLLLNEEKLPPERIVLVKVDTACEH